MGSLWEFSSIKESPSVNFATPYPLIRARAQPTRNSLLKMGRWL